MIELPAGAGRSGDWKCEVHSRLFALPDLFDFLSDGFGQREGLGLDLSDGHGPTVTGEWKQAALCLICGKGVGVLRWGSYWIPVQVKRVLRFPACPV